MSDAYNTYLTNIKRAKNFIELYNNATQNRGPGRRDTRTTDILRAGVVFLHSTFEDYLRSIILDRKIAMLSTNEDCFRKVLGNVNLVGENSGKSSAKKYALADLWNVKNENVSDIVTASLKDKVGNMTFNDYAQIVNSLGEVNIRLSTNFNSDSILDNYIKRRHKIVHEADNNISSGRGNYRATPINTTTLNAWINAVDALVQDVEANITSSV